MESYMATCRMILVTNSTTKIIDAVRSRCLQLRVPAPSVDDVAKVLMKVAKKEVSYMECECECECECEDEYERG